MHILYIHQYFKTPEESGATRSYWFAKKLVEEGHQVTMITSTMSLNTRSREELIEGIRVIYLNNKYSQHLSSLQKIWSFSKFFFKSFIKACSIKNVDLVFATSTPLTVGATALAVKWFKRKEYVFEVRDLWPEFPIQIGAVKNKLLIRVLKKLEKTIYINAKHIIALSPGMEDGILACNIDPNKVSMIPNMSKPDLFYPRNKSMRIIEQLNIDEKKLNVIHFGAMGVANGLEYLLDVARLAQEQQCTHIHFYIVGDGATLPKLKKTAEELKLTNVSFPGHYNLFEMSEIVNCCDVSLVSFKDLPILYTNSPNKLFDSLSAGKPIIVNSGGWTKDLVEKYKCGYYVNPNNSQELVDLLRSLDVNSKEYKEMCLNSRKISIDIFDKKILCDKYYKVISTCIN